MVLKHTKGKQNQIDTFYSLFCSLTFRVIMIFLLKSTRCSIDWPQRFRNIYSVLMRVEKESKRVKTENSL